MKEKTWKKVKAKLNGENTIELKIYQKRPFICTCVGNEFLKVAALLNWVSRDS